MTRRSLVFLTVLLALPLALASADIGLVFDLDGNYQNGPDTLQIEPEDTVLVHVWITGAGDSLSGSGIAAGESFAEVLLAEGRAKAAGARIDGFSANLGLEVA